MQKFANDDWGISMTVTTFSKRQRTRSHLKDSLAISASAMAVALAAPTLAQETDEEVVDVIRVVGSNIPREIDDSPQPITTIDSLDITLSGINNVSDLLRSSTFNSFGSFRERSGSSFGQIATVDLKGLGSEYTAVLINGRRVPGSPLTGASIVDLNTIPLSAIDNIEVLKDSASAIYGADAIGGVISINLKRDFDGFEVGGSIERPSLEGADAESYYALWGKTFDRGNILIGYEHFGRDAISDADRDYSRADATGPTFGNTEGVSVGGNTGFETDFSAAFPLGDCDPSVYAGVFTEPFGVPGSGCGFAYANISLQTGQVERDSFFLTSNFELNDSAELYLDARYNRNQTLGRYAPAVGFFSFPATSPFNTLGRDIDAFHRFVGHGNRDDSVDVEEITLVGGVRGEIGSIGYDAYVRYFDYSGEELGNTYVQTSVLEAEVLAGNYDVFNPLSQDPVHLAAVERSGIELSRDLKTEDLELGIGFNGLIEGFALPGGSIGWAAGVEYASQEYTDIYDEFREAVDVLGSAGNSAEGERERYAVFGEVRFPITETFEINVAGRYDEYDDIGEEFSPQVNARWAILPGLKVRGSWGEGFKAPNLIDLYQEPAESFDDLADQFRCEAQGIAPGDCPTFQVQNFSGGNPQLEAETSEAFNVGVIGDLGGFSASVDYYEIEITNQVTQLSLDQVNDREAAGTLPAGVIVNRGATVDGVPGAIIDIRNVLTNGASLETSGIDVGVNYQQQTPIGDFAANVSWVRVLSYDQQTSPESEVDDLLGTENGSDAFPENRVATSLRYTRDNITLTWNTNYIDSFRNVSDTDDYDSWLGHDVTFNWRDPLGLTGAEFTTGVLNLTEEEPSIDPNPTAGYNASVVLQLYEVRGRIPFVSLKYRFGG